ncbi:RcnB family protein [Polymorphobacter sp. PAMC 29334]|uniref:RcnB family protein n=1 Tax=Polymorphobacter sp. PAMC 29334 TaxID=2862331 RepID=UPI001C796F92|nr:RcnB family protein [Polymorphobacter sp. PAMC 29334]QYE35555.1 RcnB family protein [Polymorphobacter sp. PAMC 29334]
MRTLILSALLLTAAVPAFAQEAPRDQNFEHRDGDHRGDNRGGDNRGGDQRGGDNRGDQRGGDNRSGDNRGFDNRGGDHRDFRGGDNRGGYAQGYRQGEHRGWGDDRRNFQAAEGYGRWRGPAFNYPRGYGYRYYAPGAFLPRVFFGGNYWIGNPGYYQLPPAYGGTRWIRVGPDALLIRGYDGYVVRVIRGIFY